MRRPFGYSDEDEEEELDATGMEREPPSYGMTSSRLMNKNIEIDDDEFKFVQPPRCKFISGRLSTFT
jgi:hypothetical protein